MPKHNPKDDVFGICGKLRDEFKQVYKESKFTPKVRLIPIGKTEDSDGSYVIVYKCLAKDDGNNLTDEERRYCKDCCSGVITQSEITLNPEML